jgi:hypothetical protein
MFLYAATEGDRTLTTRGGQYRVVDTMHHSNHITLHKEADTTQSHMNRHSHTERHQHLTDLILGTMVLSQQWAETTMVSIPSMYS